MNSKSIKINNQSQQTHYIFFSYCVIYIFILQLPFRKPKKWHAIFKENHKCLTNIFIKAPLLGYTPKMKFFRITIIYCLYFYRTILILRACFKCHMHRKHHKILSNIIMYKTKWKHLFFFLLKSFDVKKFFLFIGIYFTELSNFYLPGRKYRANLGCPVF